MWLALQFAGLALLIACGVLWTRIPEKQFWQVLLTLLVPLLIAGAFLWLQGGTIRAMLRQPEGDRTGEGISIVWGSATLLLWIVIGWMLWTLVDRFDDHIYNWAGYLNSRFDADYRSHFLTFEHLSSWLSKTSWLLRWVVVPGLLLPLGVSAAFGLRRTPWKCVMRVWINWRWWPMLLVLTLIGQAWPATFFDTDPHGTVQAQVWRVILKISAAYVLAVWCWTVALAWLMTLVANFRSRFASAGIAGEADRAQLPREGGQTERAVLPMPDPEQDVGGNA
jgi:hypothetical protein